MSTSKLLLAALLFAATTATGCARHASQPDERDDETALPAEIPEGIPADVRKEIGRLHSADPEERRDAVWALAAKGQEAIPAIPFLISMLGDDTSVFVSPGPVIADVDAGIFQGTLFDLA